MIDSKPITLADAANEATGITQSTGVILIEATLADATERSAVFTLYNNDGTPTTVLTAGSGTYFSITKATDTKINVYWETNQIYVENQAGQAGTFIVKFLGKL